MPEKKDKTRVPSDIFSSILLDEINQNIKNLNKAVQNTIPEGTISSFIESIDENPSEFRPREPWFSITVYNRGPNPVHVGVNVGHGGGIKIEAGDSFPVDLGASKIRYVKLWCDKGETTNIKLIAVN